MANIVDLPLELIREIESYLVLSELCNLAKSYPALDSKIFGSESFCKELVQKLIPSSYEATLAKNGKITCRKALINVHQRRFAYASCRPYAVLAVASVSDFLYNDIVFCHRVGYDIYVTRLHSAEASQTVKLDLKLAFPKRAEEPLFRLVSCKDDVLIVRVRTSKGRKLAVFNVNNVQHNKHKPELMISVPEYRLELIRNNSDHVVVGVYRDALDGIGATWHFSIFSLHGEPPQQLRNIGNFGTSEVGLKIVVEILDGYLWVISSQITHDVESSDPTSFYGGCRVRLAAPSGVVSTTDAPTGSTSTSNATVSERQEPTYFRLWRRQHIEGPIHDGWLQLSLSHSESAAPIQQSPLLEPGLAIESQNSPEILTSSSQRRGQEYQSSPYIISETRAEWTPTLADPVRSFYRTKFTPLSDSPDAVIPADPPQPAEAHLTSLERLARATIMNDSEEYVEGMLAEIGEGRVDLLIGARERLKEIPKPETTQEPARVTFKLSKTLHSAFDASAGLAMDIVLDSTETLRQPSPLLRLQSSASKYSALWPPQHTRLDQSLANLLVPPLQGEKFNAYSNSRAVVFGAKVPSGRSTQVTIISFDPLANWQGVPGIEKVDVKTALSDREEGSLMLMLDGAASDIDEKVGSQPTSLDKGKMTRASTPESDWDIGEFGQTSASAADSPGSNTFEPIMSGDVEIPEETVEEGKPHRFGSRGLEDSDDDGVFDGALAVLMGDI